MTYTYPYPRPALTVDCIIFGRTADQEIKVLLIKRAKAPFQGLWALPGGFVDEQETVEIAAQRELAEETGVDQVVMEQLAVFSKPGRDPRGWTVSVAFYATVDMKDCQVQAADDAEHAEWVDLDAIQEMAFDHREILAKARSVTGY